MKKYTANYSYSNHNFVIQNLKGNRIDNEYLPVICILKNILQRGCPTLLSKYLHSELGSIHKSKEFVNPYPLIDTNVPKWERIIRGDLKGNYFPAKKFFEELIPKYLPDYKFIQQLIIPELSINEITKLNIDEFKFQQVDFYLPQAFLIIEIDGSQHEETKRKDRIRDNYTLKYLIETVRIKTKDLEKENETFIEAVEKIKARIKRVGASIATRKEKEPHFISIEDYREAYENGVDLNNPFYKSTAVMRFQLLILELLELGKLKFDQKWEFEIFSDVSIDFAELALNDLFIWFEYLFKLHKLRWKKPEYILNSIDSNKEFSTSNNSVKVNFSLKKRYTDWSEQYPKIIFVRTDYLDEYLYFKNANANTPTFSGYEKFDYFKISTSQPVKYKLKLGGKDSDDENLLFLLENIFLQDVDDLQFNEGQLPIITNALMRNDTIGLLPTGSGKSVCYQLASILQPAVSFVVCPIKSLMYDQKADLESSYFTRINQITSDDDGEDKAKIQYEFGSGKYLFIFISPERFQIKTFRNYFSTVNKNFNIAYAVIDEVHCLSEWGHDFRTAYLNLSNTIQKLCSDFNFIGLTATASINVLKDIQIEFGIKQENVKTPIDYTRKELEFEVIDDNHNKQEQIKNLLIDLDERENIFKVNGYKSKCGIIFTPTVGGKRGCYPLSQMLSNQLSVDIKYYSGSVPKINQEPIMSITKYDQYKRDVQTDFKKNKFTVLTATKAFGMGVNKPNVYFTIHYGIPGSMESLYQEGGRAGRDKIFLSKEKAKCYVLLSKSNKSKQFIDQFWNPMTSLTKINAIKREIDGDLNTNIFMFTLGHDIIKDEFDNIKKVFDQYAVSNEKLVKVEGKKIGLYKSKTEKAIYRLNQMGIVEDWTIEDFFGGGVFEVDFYSFELKSIKDSLFKTINKYDPEFSIRNILDQTKYETYRKILQEAPPEYSEFDKYILVLLQWSYNNFAYNRRQSLKNIYENCCEFSEGNLSKNEFKIRLENYFKFNQKSYILQHIAENPLDFEKWFEVFYQIEDNEVSNKIITNRQAEALRDNLSRFLESYMYNSGLDLISGIVRLWLNDYENIDGRNRLESSLEEITSINYYKKDEILNKILKICKELSDGKKSKLAKSLYKFYFSEEYLNLINEELGDSFSMFSIIEIANTKLININNRIYGGFKKSK